MKKQDVSKLLNSPELLEALAHVEHERWSGWEKYRAKCVASPEREEHEARWKKQRETAYADLSEKEKESDRVEARKSLSVIKERFGSLKKAAYFDGAQAAFSKLGLAESVQFVRPTTSSHGQAGAISQAFNTNAALGQPNSELASATNNILQPGSPPGGSLTPRRFMLPTDQMGDGL